MAHPKNFFDSAINEGVVAYGLAFAFQYGQTARTFSCSPRTGPRVRTGHWCVVGFIVCAAIDADTNVAELFRANPGLSDNVAAMLIMVVVLIAVVFVEEVMSMAFAWALNNTNEFIKSLGGESVGALEWLEGEARHFDPRGAR